MGMFDELGDGVYRRRYESLDLNIGVIVGEDGVLVVDTRASQVQADELKAELASVTSLPVRWVVNTHYHWDHTFGNARFKAAELWGHQRCRDALLHNGEEMKQDAKRWLAPEFHEAIDAVEVVPPTMTFSDTASLQIGRAIEMKHHGMGHTDSDITVAVPDAGVVFAGDLVEEGSPPVFSDGFPIVWPTTLSRVLEGISPLVVPGHGDVVDRTFVAAQRDDLVIVAERASSCVAGSLSLEDAVDWGPYPPEVMRSAIARAIEVA